MPCLPVVEARAFGQSFLRLERIARSVTARLSMLLLLVLPLAASAAVTNYVWDGGANGNGNTRWSRVGNWNPNVAPPANNVGGLTNTDITFSGSLKTTPLMDSPYFVRALMFNTNAAAFTLTSQNTEILSIGAGGIVNNSSNIQTIVSGVNVSSAQTWNASGGALVFRGNVNLGANLLTIDGARAVSMTNIISGSGSITKQGAGTLTLAGTSANTYSGGTTLNAGTITVAKVNALGSGALTVNGGTLNLGSQNQTVGVFTLAGGTVNGTTATLTASGYQVQSGILNVGLVGTASLIKSGAGVTTLTSPSSFSGGTIINSGTLAVNNTTGSGTGTGNVTINSGGTLRGTGTIFGMVTNRSGGIIAPGNSVGQLNTGTEFWLGGSTYLWEMSNATGSPGTGWDLLNITGALNISATSGNLANLDLVSFTLGGTPGAAANFDPSQSYLWRIAQTTTGITFAPGENESSVFNLLTGGFVNPINGGIFAVTTSNGGRDLNLTFTPSVIVPEPSVFAFGALCLCGYIYGRRWKRHWSK